MEDAIPDADGIHAVGPADLPCARFAERASYALDVGKDIDLPDARLAECRKNNPLEEAQA